MFGFMAKLPTVPAFNIVTMMTLSIRVASLIAIPAARLAYPRFIWRLPPFGGVRMRVLLIHERPCFATLSFTIRSASVGVWPRFLDMVTSGGLRMMRSELIVLLMTCVMARAPDIPEGVVTVIKMSGLWGPMVSTTSAMLLRVVWVARGPGWSSVAYPSAQTDKGFRR